MEDAARRIAAIIIEAAREHGYLTEPLATIPEVAEEEKKLFLRMFEAVRRRREEHGDDLSCDEVASMFTFVLAKAAEIVTAYICGRNDEPSLDGLFDGKIPVYADDRVMAFCRQCGWPSAAGTAFWNADRGGGDPLLTLFEALKWTFRIAEHIIIIHIEESNRK